MSLNFNQVGTNVPVIQDIIKNVVDKGKSQTPKDKVGENLYNRGVYNSMIIAEAIRNAQKITGKKVIDGADMRRGLETLEISEARLKEMGAAGFVAPVKTPADVIPRLQTEVAQVLATPEFARAVAPMALNVIGNSPADFAQRIRTDAALVAKIAKQADLKLDD